MARKLSAGTFYATTVHLEARLREAVTDSGYTMKTAVNAALLDFLGDPMSRDQKIANLASFAKSNSPTPGTASPASGRPGRADSSPEESSAGPSAGNGGPG